LRTAGRGSELGKHLIRINILDFDNVQNSAIRTELETKVDRIVADYYRFACHINLIQPNPVPSPASPTQGSSSNGAWRAPEDDRDGANSALERGSGDEGSHPTSPATGADSA
jgi:hypothetical protein